MSLAYSALAYSRVPLADWHEPSSIDAQLAATETTGVEDATEPIAPTRAGSAASEAAIMIVKIVRTSTIMIHGLRACTSQPRSRRSSHEFLSQPSPSPKDIPRQEGRRSLRRHQARGVEHALDLLVLLHLGKHRRHVLGAAVPQLDLNQGVGACERMG